jgi:hypothetical protein
VTVTGLPARDSKSFSPPTTPTLGAGTNPVKTCCGYQPPKFRIDAFLETMLILHDADEGVRSLA